MGPYLYALSDIHLSWLNPVARKDDLTRTQWEKLAFIFDMAKKEEAIILIAGDLTEGPRSWKLLPKLLDFFYKYKYVRVLAVRGQHDSYYRNEKANDSTLLGALNKAGFVKILNHQPYLLDCNEAGVHAFYGSGWGEDIPEPLEIDEHINVLVTHREVSNTALYPGQKVTQAAYFLRKYYKWYTLTVVGDQHIQFYERYKGSLIFNAGPMLRSTASETDFKHRPCFLRYNINYDEADPQCQIIDIPHKNPREVISAKHLDKKKQIDQALSEFIEGAEKLKTGKSDKVKFKDVFKEFVEVNNIEDNIVQEITSKLNTR